MPAEEAVASHTERKPLKTTPSGRRLRAGAAAISMLSLNMSNLNRGSAHSQGEQEGHTVLASHYDRMTCAQAHG